MSRNRNGFKAQIYINGKPYAKRFKTLAEAKEWRENNERKIFPYSPLNT